MFGRWIGLLLFLGIVGAAEVLVPGKVYSGPLKLTAEHLGASFMLPEGWLGEWTDPSGPVVMQDSATPSRILLEANVSVVGDPLALLGRKRSYYGLNLFSPAQIKRMRPSLYYRFYEVKGSDTFAQALCYLVIGTQGRAAVLYGFFTPGTYESMRQTMLTLAEGLSFTAIRALPYQRSSLFLQLAGAHLVYFERSGSYSERRELWLCRNGDIFLEGNYSADNHTSRVTKARQGTWQLEEETLELVFDEGFPSRLRVETQNGNLLIDGAQTFRLPNRRCE